MGKFLVALAAVAAWSIAMANADASVGGPRFKKVMVLVLENADYAGALSQPFIAKLARQGALLTNFMAEGHPSQPNYVALVSGSTNGVVDDSSVTLSASHLGELLEAKGRNWKVYAGGYPGGCFLGAQAGKYVRKHVPFLSFKDVQSDKSRCARIVDASQLDADLNAGTVPDFSLYVPDLNDDGHDTGVAYADRWLSKSFAPYLSDPRFAQNMLLALTFDENEDDGGPNRVATILWGDPVRAGATSAARLNHYSLLRMVENEFGLGTLGLGDSRAAEITGVWK